MKYLKNILLTLLSLLLLAIVVGGLFMWTIVSKIDGRNHVPDEELISNLQTQMNQYELLITMFNEDSPASVIHSTWMSPDNVISLDRWEEYKILFKDLGLDAGMRSWGGESIWFISTASGLVTGGSSKGYMYKPESPIPLFSSLDQIPEGLKSNVEGYRQINNDWYIVFSWDD